MKMKLKKTIVPDTITDAIITVPYMCLNEGFIQIMVRCDSDKVADKTYKILEADYTPELIKGVKDWAKTCMDYVQTLPEYADAEEIIEVVE